MRKFFTTLISCALVALSTVAQPVIYGSMTENSSWGYWDSAEGIYSFSASEDGAINPVFTDGWDLAATAGGVLVDNIYHLFYNRGGSSIFSVAYTAYKIDDWSTDYSCYFSDVIVSNDMTCDPTTDIVYCAQPSAPGGRLVTWDPVDIDNIGTIGTLPTEVVAIAANASGELYGIGVDGGLYSIDKKDASMTLIGDTGVEPRGYQSAVFDLSSGVLYWAAYTQDKVSSLYTIDTATGAATLVKDFADNARFAGLYMLSTSTPSDAPSAVKDFTAQFESGSNSGVVSFTMPSSTFGGEELSGEFDYTVSIDGDQQLSGKAQAGEKVQLDLTIATGEHQLVLVTTNAAGESPRSKLKLYVGKGVPGYASYATATPTQTPNEFVITWEAPDYCSPLDAYFDPSELRYNVVRQPDNVLVADHIAECSVTDVIDYNGELKIFKYQIYPFIDELAGNASTTNGVAVGNPFEPPYHAVMAEVDLDLFTIIDANHDGSTWYKDFYGYGVGCGGRWDGASDDWLILPPLHLNSDGVYNLSLTVGHDYDGPSKWELKIGNAPTVDAMTRTLMAASSTTESFEDDIKVPEEGTYYIGVHCIGTGGTTMYLADVTLRASANNNAPEAPINLSGVGAEKGELAAYVTFTTPQTSISGDRLDTLTAVNIYHGEKLVYTLEEGVEPDTEYTCKVDADQEFNTYSVAAVNEFGEGRRATVEYVFAGYDFPSQVSGFQFTIGEDGHPVLSWDPASEEGVYGYYVNPDDVTYTIYRGYGNDNYDIIVEDFKGTSFVDEELSGNSTQFMLTYLIYPWNSIGMGYGSSSNTECYGRPYQTPFVERFTDGKSDYNPWSYRTLTPETSGWSIYHSSDTTVEDIDGSDGVMVFIGTNKGDEATLNSPYVTVKGVENPVLEFYYYTGRSIVTPTVSINEDVVTNTNTFTAEGTDWQRFVAPLDAYTSVERIQLQFQCKAKQDNNYAFIDNIRVRRMFNHDMAISRIIVPEEMELDKKTTVSVVVANDGSSAMTQAKVTLYRNGYAVDEAVVENLQPAESTTLRFKQVADATFGEHPTFYATVEYDLDQDLSNNTSLEAASSMKISRYPAPEDVHASVVEEESGVELTWTAPTATSMAPEAITEDFEDYEAFTTELEGWTMVDGDKCGTVIMSDPMVWYEYLDYPEAGQPMAYQVFNPEMVGIDTEYFFRYAPYSGEQALICWSTDDFGTANDDWLISPELFPGGQTISFWVYSRTGYFDFEKYQVLYSSTDTETSSFELLVSDAALDEWTKVTVELPQDAKYFAIHTVSYQSNTEIWFDDITFIPATSSAIPLEIQGYNVYRDNVKINEELVKETSYVDNTVSEGEHKYNVTAVYGVGESALSEDAFVTAPTALNPIGMNSVKVVGGKGEIRVQGASGRNLKVISTSGMTLKQQTICSDNVAFPMTAGIYVVTVDHKPFKVIVK